MAGKRRLDITGIIKSEEKFNKIQDLDILLECILSEACLSVNADAGSIYVVEGNMLSIRYSRNDTKQKDLPPGEKMIYSFFSFPINEDSIAGYCAKNKTLVNEPDVYAISDDKPYSFNSDTDIISGYRTKSNMAIPLVGSSGKLLGVIQVLNKKNDRGEGFIAFTGEDELYVTHFATIASNALEHAALTRSMILRMIKLSELRDPKETGAHVSRVASYSVEIFDRLAYKKKLSKAEIDEFRDVLKIAAMLHDVGKVGISDLILKKPGRFTPEEYEIMKSHTSIGGQLFNDASTKLDYMSRDVAMTHHENWDGTGYPKGLSYEDIPLGGRIVALADVFDALSSKRVYKPSWKEEDVLEEIKKEKGNKFDPEVVDAFFDVYENIKQIQKAFPDTDD
ncbi:MAG: HD domain-containing protein [Spirochaetes bacterium]|uniref:HD domain-containing protein n=1 Tax=Candidatus Gallitreponema excrementavium TaxID=2840840 RepID=A0A9D9N2Y2_9SPIR|nr:HD domain-containing protein [Candidatus Gallitreponema excrementavium]